MEVRTCKRCGSLFNYMGGGMPLCAACNKALEAKFQEVKQYIYDHPEANIKEVAEDNEVSVSIIKKWVREERLTFAKGSAVGIECERCGKTILTGRFCEECKRNVIDSFTEQYKTPEPKVAKKKTSDSAKMRFLSN